MHNKRKIQALRQKILRHQKQLGGNFVFEGKTCYSQPSLEDCNISNNIKKIAKLGQGNFGAAYLINENGMNMVLKEIRNVDKNSPQYKTVMHEVCIGKALGDAGIAPRIFKGPWFCKSTAFYTLELMKGTWAKYLPTSDNWAKKNKVQRLQLSQTLTEGFKKMERQLVANLERMIELGIVHNDNHPDNIGLMEHPEKKGWFKTVLFDFGLALDYDINKDLALQTLLAHIYITLEHYDDELFSSSELLDIAYLIRRNEYEWGKHRDLIGEYIDLSDCIKTDHVNNNNIQTTEAAVSRRTRKRVR